METRGFSTSGEIFRKDNRIIIARNRHHAVFIGVHLKYDAAGYLPGQAIALNSVSGLWEKYLTGGSSGTDVCTGIMFDDIRDMPVNTKATALMLAKGEVYESLCIDLDSAAKVDLGGRSVVDANGTTVFMF